MNAPSLPAGDTLVESLRTDAYAFVDGAAMRARLAAEGELLDWPDFAASWAGMPVDTYMADGGRYRTRRHAVFAVTAESIRRQPHQAHYQSRDYNPLHGGIERWFEPIPEQIAAGASMGAVLRCCRGLFDRVEGAPRAWHVELHQFRIEALPGAPGQPTPEGMHRDGVDYVLVLLIQRHNIKSGTTSIHDLARRPLGSFTLTHPCDAALVHDARVYHGVTAVEPLDPARPAYRDVLVVTFRKT
jgi:hypothetical protein